MDTKLCSGCLENKPLEQDICKTCGYDENAPVVDIVLPPGLLLENRYIIGKSIGIGGFGITYIAMDTRINVKVAIKEFFIKSICQRSNSNVMVSDHAKNKKIFKTFKEKFINEAKLLADYNMNDGVVAVSNYFNENETAYIVMEYLEGMTLDEHLKKYGQFVTFSDAVQSLQPIMIALKEIHKKGVIHRDISPDNIFITQEGEVKLLDFGAARENNIDNEKQLSVVLKQGFAPLEQYNKKGKQGPYTDVYALGATIYKMLEGKNLPESVEILSKNLEMSFILEDMHVSLSKKEKKILSKMIALEHKDRYQTIEDVLQAFGISNKSKGQKRRKRKSFSLPKPVKLVASIVYYLLITVGIGYFSFLLTFEKIPNYEGLTYSDIENQLELHQMSFDVVYEYSDRVDKGIITNQTFKNAYYHRWNKNILTVSLGSNEKIEFEDRNLGHIIASIVDKPVEDLLLGDVLNIQELELSSSEIKSLVGIEHLIHLKSLNLSHNQIEDVSPLKSLHQLKILNLYDNNIRTLEGINSLHELESLTLANNYISDLKPIESLASLKELNIIHNNLSQLIDFSEMTALTSIYLSSNNIRDIEKLSTLKNVKIVLLSDNQVFDLEPLLSIHTLEYVNVENNSLDLDLSFFKIEQLEKRDTVVIY